MSNNADTPGDPNHSGEAPDDRLVPAQTPRDADVDESTSSDAPHIIYNPPPTSRAETARQERALRRMYHQRKAHPWLKKIPWITFPTYGFMRLHDPNYEEHYEQWKEQQRRNYDGR
jgi:hypothetical protein